MTEDLLKAKQLLQQNGYKIIKWTKAMDEDADECEASDCSKDCLDCACNVCLMQL